MPKATGASDREPRLGAPRAHGGDTQSVALCLSLQTGGFFSRGRVQGRGKGRRDAPYSAPPGLGSGVRGIMYLGQEAVIGTRFCASPLPLPACRHEPKSALCGPSQSGRTVAPRAICTMADPPSALWKDRGAIVTVTAVKVYHQSLSNSQKVIASRRNNASGDSSKVLRA